MALFTRKRRTEDVSEPAKLLITDHMKVERIFAEIDSAESPNMRKSLVTQLEAELTRHTTIEENVLYPFVEEHVAGGEDLIDEAENEHQEASLLLDKLANLDPSSPEFDPTVKALEKAVSHHVKEEEHELFPKLEDATDEATLAKLRLDLENEKLGLTPSPTMPSEVGGGRAKPSSTPSRSSPRATSSGSAGVWVQPHPKDDRWQVKREGATRASRVFDTQRQAEQFARNLAKRERVELVIASRDGSIREKRSYGNDPPPSPADAWPAPICVLEEIGVEIRPLFPRDACRARDGRQCLQGLPLA
jgi:iron-sulfur cluster repair protein YtfE (RIC family)